MTAHTPEPWAVYEGPEDRKELTVCYEDKSGQIVCVADCLQGEIPPKERDANAARIIACVNGCAGLTEDEIKEAIHWYRTRKQAGMTSTLKRDEAYRQVVEALTAIVARINGEFDNPALDKYGLLELDSLEGVKRIAQQALAAAQEAS